MTNRFEAGEPVPDDLFDVPGANGANLRFEVGVRVVQRNGLRHVIPDVPVQHVQEVIQTGPDSSPHATVFEGLNTVLYFSPEDDL